MSRFNRLGHLAISLFAFEGFALVVQLFTATDTDLQFDMVALEVELGRHHRQSLLLGQADQFIDLNVMQQQFAHPGWIVIFSITEIVRTDVHVVDEHLAILDPAKGFLEIDLSGSNRFHLCAGQDDPGLKCFIDIKIMIGLFIGGDNFNAHEVTRPLGCLLAVLLQQFSA